jgi:pimeloyl-ACP methyl ester carboxylesterase
MTDIRNVLLIHGGFVDGSGWQGVYELLKADGFNVRIVQNPTITLAGDVATTTQVIEAADGPVVLVGHSYGGVVVTEAGTHNQVQALAYIAAFAPDKGESAASLPTRLRGHQCHRSFHRTMGSSFSIGRSSPLRSLQMSRPRRPPSWRIRRFLGASRHSGEP